MELAIILSLLAAIGFGSASVLARIGLQHMRSTTGTLVSLVSGFLLVGSIAFIVYGPREFQIPMVALGWFALLGIINYPLGRFFSFTGVSLAGVSRASPLLAGSPLVAVTLGVVLGGEALTLPIALGVVAIVGGVVLIVTERAS